MESHAGGVDFSFFGPALDSFRGCVRSADDMQFPGETDLLCRLECSGGILRLFQKTVEKTEKSKKMNGIFLKTVIR